MTADMDLDNNETIDADVDDEEEENPRKYGGVKQQFAKGMKKGVKLHFLPYIFRANFPLRCI